MPHTLAGLAFDAAIVGLDGTMVDTVGDFEVALVLPLADLGLPPVGRAFIARRVGKGSEQLLTRTLAEIGADPSLQEQAWVRYQHHYLAINGLHSAVYSGVVEGLKALRARGMRLVCTTNKPASFARPLLAAKSLDGYFKNVFGGDAFGQAACSHLDDRGLQQRRGCGPRGGVSGGMGQLWLKPRRTGVIG